MAQKAFSIYTPGSDLVSKNTDTLVVEIGVLHIACVVKRGNRNGIVAVELFNYTKDEGDNFEVLFQRVMVISRLLDKSYTNTLLYVNTPASVLIPYSKFNKDIAADYVNITHGIPATHEVNIDQIKIDSPIMNAYGVCKEWLAVSSRNLMMVTSQHTYTKLLTTLLTRDNLPEVLVKVQFYHHYFIVAVVKNGKLQVIQTFTNESNADVLYYLLSTVNQTRVATDNVVLEISGMIDHNSDLYANIAKHFAHIQEETVDPAHLLFTSTEHPSHYFTPFYNLAL